MTTRRRSRPGVTLTEVLIAMFVMALGMLALLTLFPLGVFQIGQALKDDRTTQTASQADGVLRSLWRNQVVQPLNDNDPTTLPDPFVWAMDDPNLLLQKPSTLKPGSFEDHYGPYLLTNGTTVPQMSPLPITPTTLMTGETWSGAPSDNPPITGGNLYDPLGSAHYVTPGTAGQAASYPVMIDPLGYLARPNALDQRWVANSAGNTSPLIPRRNLSVGAAQMNGYQAIQTCCLVDDFTFRPNGSATTPGVGGTTRQGRYSWAAIVQRPVNATRDVATLKIMVFDGRPPLLATPGDEVIVTTTVANPGTDRSIVVDVPNRSADQAPLVRKGGWIMDGTISINPLNSLLGIRHANFYRIAGVSEGAQNMVTNTTQYTLDLETAIQRTDGQTGPAAAYTAQIYLFAGLSEVFDRPALRPDP